MAPVRWHDAARAPLPSCFVPLTPPGAGADEAASETWLALTTSPLAVAEVYEWSVRPDCGAVVLFSGTVRDHAEGRPGVAHLTYEAYEEQVVPRLAAIATEIREQWPATGRIALLHRTGRLELGTSSVIVAVSAPHRGEAFEAARFGIDTLKATVPIWKQETWDGGQDWALGAQSVTEVS
jgi:molybdopterin synthase catalytic subunit